MRVVSAVFGILLTTIGLLEENARDVGLYQTDSCSLLDKLLGSGFGKSCDAFAWGDFSTSILLLGAGLGLCYYAFSPD